MRTDSTVISFVANTVAIIVQLAAIVSIVATTVHFVTRRATEVDITPTVVGEGTIATFTIQGSSPEISVASSKVDSLVLG